MIRVATLRRTILALTCAVSVLIALPAIGEEPPTGIETLTLKDAPVEEVIRLIAQAQDMDVLMTDDVQGTVSMNLSQKTPEEILDLICAANKLYWWKERGVYVVSGEPRGSHSEPKPVEAEPLPESLKPEETRAVLTLEYMKAQDLAYFFGGADEPYTDSYRRMQKVVFPYGQPGERVGQPLGVGNQANMRSGPRARTAAAVSGNPFEELSQVVLPGVIEPAPGAGEVLPGEELAAEEELAISAGAPLEHMLPEGLSPPVAFAPLNALIVQGPPEAIEQFRKLVETLDVRIPQVMVEAQFVEMRVEDARRFGIDWSWIGGETSMDVAGIAAGGNVGISFAKGNFTALLQALLNEQRARVINAPRLATMNNQPVTFTISRTFFYFTSETVVQPPGFAGSQVITSNILNALPVVTTFTILPQVNGDNSITCDVTTVISDIAGFITGPDGEQIPQPTATTLPTRLRVDDGETIVMGGFIRKNISESKRKVPLLSEIPIIGKILFTGTSYDYSDSELLIFLTAYIMAEKGTQVGGAREETRV
ncbi:MAG: type II secretion system protein GspD, partial [Armatimonadota bacterium]